MNGCHRILPLVDVDFAWNALKEREDRGDLPGVRPATRRRHYKAGCTRFARPVDFATELFPSAPSVTWLMAQLIRKKDRRAPTDRGADMPASESREANLGCSRSRGGAGDIDDCLAFRRPWLWLGGLILLSAVLYSPAWSGEFLWDDVTIYIVNNSLLHDAEGLYRFWFTLDAADYYPLTYTSFWIEWRLAGDNPALYHVTNVVLHAATAWVLHGLLWRLRIPYSWLACLLFLAHPLQVESVAWISQRKTILGALFGFASASEYLKSRECKDRRFHWRSVALFALSLAGKPCLIAAPVLLAFYEWRRAPNDLRQVARRTSPYFALAIVFGLIGVMFQRKAMGGLDVRNQDFLARTASLGWAAWFYVVQTVRVWDLSFVYPRWKIDGSDWIAWLPNAAAVGILVATWTTRRRRGATAFAACVAYLLTMAPSLGITDVFYWRYSYVGDHYSYQSLPAIFVAFGAMIGAATSRLRSENESIDARWPAACGLAIVAALAMATFQRSSLFADEELLWRDALAKNSRASLAYSQLGARAMRAGRPEDAKAYFRQALERDPSLFEVWRNLGVIARSENDWTAAGLAFQEASRLAPPGSFVARDAMAGLVGALLRAGRVDEATELLNDSLSDLRSFADAPGYLQEKETLVRSTIYQIAASKTRESHDVVEKLIKSLDRLIDGNSSLHREAAIVFQEVGEPDKSLEHWRWATRRSSQEANLLAEAGSAAMLAGQLSLARDWLVQAIAVRPEDPGLHSKRGMVHMAMGDAEEGIASLRTATELATSDPKHHSNLAIACASTGRHKDASASFRRVLSLAPDEPNAMRDLAWLLSTTPLADDPVNVREALALARSACDVTGGSHCETWDALAAAQAAAGDFAAARNSISRAMKAAQKSGRDAEQVARLRRRSELYAEGKPFREAAEVR